MSGFNSNLVLMIRIDYFALYRFSEGAILLF